MLYRYEDIRYVDLEITDKCNASCPMCGRNKNGGEINPWISLTELTLDECKSAFIPSFIKQLRKMFMCGNVGEATVAEDTLEIYRYFRTHNSKLKLGLNTNGFAQNSDWWSELANIMDDSGYVTFGLDGLTDTHHLYRKDTNFEAILENAKAFIDAGGDARWEFIVFKHNEHQVEEACNLSKKLGFTEFHIKKTGWFFDKIEMKNKESYNVHNDNGKTIYVIEPPKNPAFQNEAGKRSKEILDIYGNMENYLNQISIICKATKKNSIFVSATGHIFPCCWTGHPRRQHQTNLEISKLLRSTGGLDKINFRKNTIKEIVEGNFFQQIKKSWSLNTIENGRLETCAKTCGIHLDTYRDQSQ